MPIDFNKLNLIFGIFVFLFGLSIGSFLNLVAYRIPLNISIVKPKSHCPTCKSPIKIIGLIPVFGYFFLHGKCSYCQSKISLQYPIVEFFTGIFSVFVFFHFLTPMTVLASLPSYFSMGMQNFNKFYYQDYVPFFVSLWILYTGIPLSIIDIKYRILPNVITIPGIFIGLSISYLNPQIGIIGGLLGILVGGGGLLLVSKLFEWIRKKEGMGMGDIKYLAFIGAVLGVKGVILTLFIASVFGSITGIAFAIKSKSGLSTSIPFGPFLAAAAFVTSVYSNQILEIFLY